MGGIEQGGADIFGAAKASNQALILAAMPKKNSSGSTIIENAKNKFRDGFALLSPDPELWDVVWTSQADSFVNQGGNAAGASYLRVSMSPYTPSSQFMMTSKQMFEFPVRAGYGLSISQRIIGQEVEISLVGCDADGVVDEIAAVSDLAISGTVTIASNVATINFASAHGLNGGDRVVLYGNTESRLNVGPVAVTVVNETQITVPCTLANGTYTAGGYVAWADPLAYVANAVGLLHENATATNASFVARRNGAKFKTVNSTVSTTTAIQSNANAFTDAFNAAGDMELVGTMEEVYYNGKASDALSAPTGNGRYSQGIPDEGKFYKLRVRVKNLSNFSKIAGKISAISKSGTTTFTVTTSSPHGLVTGNFCQIYGVRDQTNFANITTAVAVTVLNDTQFTIVGAGTGTANSAGGIVVLNQGSVALPGAIALAIQSISRTNNLLTVTMNTTSTGLLPGEYCELAGMDGSGAVYDGSYKVLRVTGSTYVLESVGDDFGSISCGGAVVKRTDVRLNYIKLMDYTRMVVEQAYNRGMSDAAKAMPVVPVSLPTLAQVTKAGLDAQAVVDIASAALTSTATSSAIAMTNIQACAFSVAVTAISGTPTLDVVVQETVDGTNWYDIYHFERITGTGNWNSPMIPIKGQSIRYVRTVGGGSPSLTNSVTREQRMIATPLYRRIFDRTISTTTLNAATASVNSENANKVTLVVNMGAITTTAPQFQIEGSEDNVNWVALGSPLTAVASSTVALSTDSLGMKFIRVRVSTAGVGSTLGYVAIKVKE